MKGESWRTRLYRMGFNLFPVYRRTGARITFISADWREMRCRLPLNLWTRNYVGTTFGGSMFSSVDPLYMVMLIKVLGPEYLVWDKAAAIRYKRPGRSTLYARAVLEPAETEEIKSLLAEKPSVDRVYGLELVDAKGTVHALVEKTVYIASKSPKAEKEG